MDLNDELKELEALKSDPAAFEAKYASVSSRYTSAEEAAQIGGFVEAMLAASGQKIDAFIEKSVKMQLAEVSEIISLSYIAKKYFNKTRNWLYQKINGNIKNGKPVNFTGEELAVLNRALQDISKKIGSTVIKA
jgi:hypothetical protein